MSIDPEIARGRAQKAARARWHGDSAETTPQIDALEQAAIDRHIDELVAAAPKMNAEQADRLRRLFRYAPAEGGATG